MSSSWLKKDTAVTIKMGPFLDDTDGKTAEGGLTITQPDVRLSKNGGNYAQKNTAGTATHDELGEYDISLDDTDTDTVGRLRVMIAESGALPVWQDFMVLPANVYDSLVLGTDKLQVDDVEIGGDATALDNLLAMLDGTGGVTLSLGQLNIVASGNDSAIVATGSGTGHGAHFSGKAATGTGRGITATGGGLSGEGILAEATDGPGMALYGGPASAGLYCQGGAAGPGLYCFGDGSGSGILSESGATGHGITAVGGGTSGDGINASASTSGSGLNCTGAGTGEGILATGGTTGHGIEAVGGDTSGDGLKVVATTSGAGLRCVGVGQPDIDADITGSITGDLSGSVASVTGAVTTDAASRTASKADVSGLATAAELDTVATAVDLILEDTGELQTDDVPGLIAALSNVSTDDLATAANEAIETYRLHELMTTALTGQPTAGSLLADLTEDDGGTQRFSTNALEQSPSGGTNPNVLVNTTIASVTSQTQFTLSAGADFDDAYDNQAIVLTDADNNDYPSVRKITGYTGATRTVVIDAAPDFTIVNGDGVKVFATAPGTTAPTAAQVADQVWDEAVADHTSAGTYGQELHVVKAVLANARVHDMSGLADVIKDNDGETTLLALTPVADDVNGWITVTPS